MNRPIRVLAIGCLLLFLALLVNANYLQFVAADSLNAKSGNKRVIDEEFSRDRGSILVGGNPIAESVKSKDKYEYQRRYPEARLYAHLTGYYSYIYGRGALENSQNSILSGSDPRLFVNRVVDLVGSNQPKGGSVSLTIDRKAQEAAAAGLQNLGKDAHGSVVALDPSSGAILAMANQPSYNPNRLASHNFSKVKKAWEKLQSDKDQPMINRATQQTLPPGSTFKLVTAAAAMDKLGLKPDDKVKAGPTLHFDGIDYTLRNENGSTCGGDRITLEQALAVSCNVSFGWLAGKVGQQALSDQAKAFGFGQDYLDSLPLSPSRFTAKPGEELNDPELAQSGIGQYEVAVTPLQMAMVTGAIANGGDLMRPYAVSTVRSPDLKVLENTEPERLNQAMPSDAAESLKQMMVNVTTSGTGGSAAIDGVSVGSKTGTAQSTEDRPPYAWFVSFAPADDPKVAVAVLVESSGTARDEISGSGLAGPIAKSVMQAVLD
ncbi:MAG: peptidoglycan D,D-transpeptidase FtsI family protein [Nocardioidaceae bacterium]